MNDKFTFIILLMSNVIMIVYDDVGIDDTLFLYPFWIKINLRIKNLMVML